MSAALEFTPAVCFPIPDGVPDAPRLRLVADPARESAAESPWGLPEYAPEWDAGVSVLHVPREAERVAPVRLTRRGVGALAALVLAVGGALLWFAALSAPSTSAAGVSAVHGSQVTVRAGDTLWSIAGRVAPNSDPRAEVAALQQSNHLADEQLTPGQTLRVP